MKLKNPTVLRTAAALSTLTAGALVTVVLTTGAHSAPLDPVGAPAAGSPTVTASPTAAGSPPASASADAAPAPSGSPAGSGAASNAVAAPPTQLPDSASPKPAATAPSGSPAGSGTASNTKAAPPAPLPAAQLPDSAAAQWKPIAPPHTQPVRHQIQLNECADVNGAATWQQQGYVSSFHTPAIQDTFTFADAAAAQDSYHAVLTAMDGCQATSAARQTASKITPDAQVTRTATTADGSAYARQWTGVAPISAAGRQTNHIYVVQRGSVLTVLQYAVPATTTGATPQTPDDDQKQLALIDAQLTTAAGN
ncbi:hypothetical protein ACIG5E_00030 [Kitasatospora sp. NPDC053057]|uniref:hypothetical protein n=1 Tax=Kitasatospora sp. NPDC053057 TaxID=3364062 RepID=UPI0037C5CF5F